MSLKSFKRVAIALPLVVGVSLFATASADAVIRYAAPASTGDPSVCSFADPCSLANALSSGDTADGYEVILLPGVYSISSTVAVAHAMDVHGTGAPSDTQIVVTGSPVYGVQVNVAGAKLRNISMTDNGSTEGGVHMIAGTLQNSVIFSNSSYGCASANALIRDSICVSRVNSFAGVSINEGPPGSFTTTLRNVTAIGSGGASATGVTAYGGGSQNATINGIGVIARGGSTDVSAANIGGGFTSQVNLSNSNFATRYQGISSSTTAPGSGTNQTAAPLFVDAAGGDYHQAAGSPTIDAGALDASSGATDVDGDARTLGAAPDIGADEFVPPPVAGPGGGASDTTAPNTSLTNKPSRRSKRRKATFTFTSSEPGSTFRCKLDRGTFKNCRSPLVFASRPASTFSRWPPSTRPATSTLRRSSGAGACGAADLAPPDDRANVAVGRSPTEDPCRNRLIRERLPIDRLDSD